MHIENYKGSEINGTDLGTAEPIRDVRTVAAVRPQRDRSTVRTFPVCAGAFAAQVQLAPLPHSQCLPPRPAAHQHICSSRYI